MEARLIDVGDGRLSVYDAGSGPAVVFLHGNASRWQHWEPQLRALSGRLRCIAFDQRGYGASSPLTGANSLSRMADDTAALCAALGVARAYVVGLSMGGEVAQALALRHPALVAGLVLAGTSLLAAPPGGMPELTADLLRQLLGAGFGPALRQQRPELVARLIDEHLATDLDTLRRITFDDFPAIDAARISAPTLVIAGEHDPLKPPAAARRLAETIPGAEYLELPGSGHYLNIEAAEAFTAAVARFISDKTVER